MPLGTEGLLQVVRGLDPSAPDQLLDCLRSTIETASSGNLAADDVTMMLIQASGTSTPIRETLLAPFRLFRAVRDRTRFRP